MDIEKLVEAATKAIMERLNSGGAKIAAFGEIPEGLISGAEILQGKTCADVEGCDFIVMSAQAFYEIHGKKPAAPNVPVCAPARDGAEIDLIGKRLIHERDLRDMNAARGDVVKVSKNAIVTALAYDYAKGVGAKFLKE